jgi:hypothetical protein
VKIKNVAVKVVLLLFRNLKSFYILMRILVLLTIVAIFYSFYTFNKLEPDYASDPRVDSLNFTPKSNSTNKIAVVSLHIGDAGYPKLTKQNLEKYCKLHRYDFYYFDQILNPEHTAIWQKQDAVKKIMDKDQYDYVVWIDSDIVITDMSKPLDYFINIDDSKDIYLSRDVPMNYAHNLFVKFENVYKIVPEIDKGLLPYINSGIFIIKNNLIGKMFMHDVLNGYSSFNSYFATNRFHEQSVMQHLYFSKYKDYTLVIPHTVMQSFYNYYQPGDFAIHFAGMNDNIRDYLVERYV